MRNPARIQPIINLLVKQGLFTNEQLEEWKQLPRRRLAQYLLNKCIVIEDREVKHIEWEIEKYNSLWVVEKFLKWPPKYSENQIRKFKWEKMLRDIASLPDGTLIRLDWRWPCLTTKIPWEFRDYTSNELFKPRNPDNYEIITKEEADKAIEEAMDSIHWH